MLAIGVSVGVTSSIIQGFLGQSDPLKACINDRDTPYKISATFELYVDKKKANVPANIGFDNVEEDGLELFDIYESLPDKDTTSSAKYRDISNYSIFK